MWINSLEGLQDWTGHAWQKEAPDAKLTWGTQPTQCILARGRGNNWGMGYLNIDIALWESHSITARSDLTHWALYQLSIHTVLFHMSLKDFAEGLRSQWSMERESFSLLQGRNHSCVQCKVCQLAENTESPKRMQETTHKMYNVLFVHRSCMLGDQVPQF